MSTDIAVDDLWQAFVIMLCSEIASGADCDNGAGSRSAIEVITSVGVGPSNGFLRATSSYRTTPRLQISVRASTGKPRACSGDIYATVPITAPGEVLSSI